MITQIALDLLAWMPLLALTGEAADGPLAIRTARIVGFRVGSGRSYGPCPTVHIGLVLSDLPQGAEPLRREAALAQAHGPHRAASTRGSTPTHQADEVPASDACPSVVPSSWSGSHGRLMPRDSATRSASLRHSASLIPAYRTSLSGT
ncbi:hypothetical protein ACFYXM_08395 [Streptomyces sp. NPDC002476]|uniref:hypothetical protein n=1 Tax=Streptomyces sp. NPDC002476 TaxID=3364648 RepID=UPI0036C7859B